MSSVQCAVVGEGAGVGICPCGKLGPLRKVGGTRFTGNIDFAIPTHSVTPKAAKSGVDWSQSRSRFSIVPKETSEVRV